MILHKKLEFMQFCDLFNILSTLFQHVQRNDKRLNHCCLIKSNGWWSKCEIIWAGLKFPHTREISGIYLVAGSRCNSPATKSLQNSYILLQTGKYSNIMVSGLSSKLPPSLHAPLTLPSRTIHHSSIPFTIHQYETASLNSPCICETKT